VIAVHARLSEAPAVIEDPVVMLAECVGARAALAVELADMLAVASGQGAAVGNLGDETRPVKVAWERQMLLLAGV
jgi:hypothetical protein